MFPGKRYLGQQIFANAIHNFFPGEAATTAGPFGLGVHDDLDSRLHLKGSEGQVGIWMQPKNLRALLAGQLLNCLHGQHATLSITIGGSSLVWSGTRWPQQCSWLFCLTMDIKLIRHGVRKAGCRDYPSPFHAPLQWCNIKCHFHRPTMPCTLAYSLGAFFDGWHGNKTSRGLDACKPRYRTPCHKHALCREYLSESLHLAAVRYLVANTGSLVLVQLKAGPGDLLVEILFSIRVHQQLMKVCGDAATVVDCADHVTHRLAGGPGSLLGIHLQQVVLHANQPKGMSSRANMWCSCS